MKEHGVGDDSALASGCEAGVDVESTSSPAAGLSTAPENHAAVLLEEERRRRADFREQVLWAFCRYAARRADVESGRLLPDAPIEPAEQARARADEELVLANYQLAIEEARRLLCTRAEREWSHEYVMQRAAEYEASLNELAEVTQRSFDQADPNDPRFGLQAASWAKWRERTHAYLWECVALSLDYEPQTPLRLQYFVAKPDHPACSIDRVQIFPRLGTLRRLVDFSDRLNHASRFVPPETPQDAALLACGPIAEERWRTLVVLRDFARLAVSQGWSIPQGLKELADPAAPVEGRFQKGAPANDPQSTTSPTCPSPATVAPSEAVETAVQRVPTSVTRHKIKRRAAPLDLAFEKARAKAGPGAAWSVVWDELVKDAQSESPTPPLVDVKDGVVFYGVDPARKLTREAFRKRMGRTAPGP
ncbi:hypothetical protein LOC64_12245 [Rubrivivax sp. JA1029]|uniref:hypothetical protein n=1 Tax=Rubrivivax sp. JA1029 TaxID=2894193 RepID=UPI001E4725CB|nr:hypothetical protein [Rubrivivax sp. JA1029]MCC9647775.1 hypothetical protein [Rubrivivax sp. JA1029]